MKEFRVLRHTSLIEECYVMAETAYDAEDIANLYSEEQEWEHLTDWADVEAEEVIVCMS